MDRDASTSASRTPDVVESVADMRTQLYNATGGFIPFQAWPDAIIGNSLTGDDACPELGRRDFGCHKGNCNGKVAKHVGGDGG